MHIYIQPQSQSIFLFIHTHAQQLAHIAEYKGKHQRKLYLHSVFLHQCGPLLEPQGQTETEKPRGKTRSLASSSSIFRHHYHPLSFIIFHHHSSFIIIEHHHHHHHHRHHDHHQHHPSSCCMLIYIYLYTYLQYIFIYSFNLTLYASIYTHTTTYTHNRIQQTTPTKLVLTERFSTSMESTSGAPFLIGSGPESEMKKRDEKPEK